MMRHVILLLALLIAVKCICPDEWVRYRDSCYYFAFDSSEKTTWHEAMIACSWNHNSHLVIVETRDENAFIQRHLNKFNAGLSDEFWTFGNDIHQESVWNWGISPNKINLTFWSSSQTSSHNNEDCMTFSKHLGFQWNDQVCDRNEFYICELRDPLTATGNLIG